MPAKPWAVRAAFSGGLGYAGRLQTSWGSHLARHSVLGKPTQLSEEAAEWGMLHTGCLGLPHLGSAAEAQHVPEPVAATSAVRDDALRRRRALRSRRSQLQPCKPARPARWPEPNRLGAGLFSVSSLRFPPSLRSGKRLSDSEATTWPRCHPRRTDMM